VLLSALAPMFLPLGLLMTVDPPLLLCWALATYFAAAAIFERKSWAWIAVGLFAGIGFLSEIRDVSVVFAGAGISVRALSRSF